MVEDASFTIRSVRFEYLEGHVLISLQISSQPYESEPTVPQLVEYFELLIYHIAYYR
jgi:hypothetical protein